MGRAKTYKKPNGKKSNKNYNDIVGQYYRKYIRPKVLNKNITKFNNFRAAYDDAPMRSEINQYLSEIKNNNTTLTPYLIFDICYGLIEKGGTTSQRRFKNFKGWLSRFAEKSDYKANKGDLRIEYTKHLNSKF
jgi:hypothetical protein